MPNKQEKNSHNGFPLRRIQFGLIIAVGGFLILIGVGISLKSEFKARKPAAATG